MDAAATIVRARTAARISRRELARRAGTSPATLLAYEQGAKVPQVDTLDRIVRAAGFSLEPTLRPIADASVDDRTAKGDELVAALELAGMFPGPPRAGAPLPAAPQGLLATVPRGDHGEAVATLPQKIVVLHHALDEAGIPHAFGGALALAWCTQQARGTIDIDCNVFVAPEQADDVLAALPAGVAHTAKDEAALARDGQVRLWWDRTPLDLFLNTTPYHEGMAIRARREPFLGEQLPFLSCDDLAVCKAFFNRTKDWADLEAMAEAGTLGFDSVAATLAQLLGVDDDRIARLRSIG